MVDGNRVILYSGEFHYWRLPSPALWLDRLQKVKAAGLNAVSVYFDWQYHSPAPGVYDFSGIRNIDALLTMADKLGIYVLARVGPYMNAEVDAGGLPGWILTKQLFPRAQTWNGTAASAQYSALYAQYSKEWYDHLLPILARHQVTDGKSVMLLSIENEYSQSQGSEQYMRDLYQYARDDGISVPIFHNDYWFTGDWSKVVDLYAYDSYPYGFNCCHQWGDVHFHGIDTWESELRTKLNISTPMFVSELQGGSFDPWGGNGYDAVAKTFDGDWLTDIDQSAFAQGASILNTYMYVGGTTWGYMSEPGVYSSYDYGAPISESGTLRPAYYASHRMGMFLQSFGPSLAASNYVPSIVTTTDDKIVTRARVNPQTGQIFAFLRQGDPGDSQTTRVRMPIGNRLVSVPQKKGSFITIPGHDATLLTGNVDIGPLHMNYSTSQVLTDANTSAGRYLVVYGPQDSEGEMDFVAPQGDVRITHNADVSVTRHNGELRFNYKHTSSPREISITTPTGTLRILAASSDTASRTWLAAGLIISGPDLAVDTGSGIRVDLGKQRDVTVFGAAANQNLSIDGLVGGAPDAVMGSVELGKTPGPVPLTLPALSTWKFSSEAPESQLAFDDSHWQLANHGSTTNPNVPATSTLLSDDYGFHYGYVWYRGHFTPDGTEVGITLTARQSYSVYLNGVYLGKGDESLADQPHPYAAPRFFTFPTGVVRNGQDNVISVLTESLGHDEGWLAGPVADSPQGILGVMLPGSSTTISWRIQGNAGGESPGDPERGLLNASGLWGERQGWYLPDFDDRQWTTVTAPDNWKKRGQTADIGWYRTHVTINEPTGASVPLGLTLPHVQDKAVIWVNGWLVGRYWEQRGPQHQFYVPAGVLNEHGDNVIAIAVWNRGNDGGLTALPAFSRYVGLQSHQVGVSQGPPKSITFWHTAGNRILDGDGHPVRIAAVNWSGMQTQHFVPAGLDQQPLDSIVGRIQEIGFNTIRLPFSDAMVEQNPVVTSDVKANPQLKGLHALDILDALVASAARHNIRIILDNHRSSSGVDPERNGLWYTARYPESAWLKDWETLAARYNGNPTVIGADLRNEPHTGPPGPWSLQTYLHQGATWGPYNGVDDPKTDWRLAAERGGDAVLKVNPHLLIFVEGIQQYPDATQPGGIESYWWGGILGPAAKYPVTLAVPHQLVYSPHEYGPEKYQMAFFGEHMTYDSLAANWDRHWGFLDHGPASQAPVFIGEFGTCAASRSDCVDSTKPGSQGLWFQYFIKYLKFHRAMSWGYWALNGTNSSGHDQPNYVLAADWKTLRLHELLDTLRDIELPPPPAR